MVNVAVLGTLQQILNRPASLRTLSASCGRVRLIKKKWSQRQARGALHNRDRDRLDRFVNRKFLVAPDGFDGACGIAHEKSTDFAGNHHRHASLCLFESRQIVFGKKDFATQAGSEDAERPGSIQWPH
jgi:hypothetical protein